MFHALNNHELIQIAAHLRETEGTWRLLSQAKRRERGAYAKPGLAGSVAQLEAALKKSYWQLARDLVASLQGPADDISSGRILQAAAPEPDDPEIEAALEYFGVDLSAKDQPLDRTRIAALLILIALWLRRHRAIAENFAQQLFGQGRAKAIQETKKANVAEGPVSGDLRDQLLARYDADIDRLRDGLEAGTRRSAGITWVLENAATLGLACLYLRRLFDAESFRVEMLSESLTWVSFLDGYRAGAVEATQAILRDEGVHWTEGMTAADLSESQLAELPLYEWRGPDDPATCEPCRDQLADPHIYAFEREDLPAPSDICQYGISCRHWWELVS